MIKMMMIQMAMPMYDSGRCVCQLRGAVARSRLPGSRGTCASLIVAALALCHFS